jgi:NTE family protein
VLSNIDIAKFSILSTLDKSTQLAMRRAASLKTAAAGKIIFKEGETADGLYLLLSGKVSLYKTLQGKNEIHLHTIVANEIFGEISLINKTPHDNFARVEETAKYLFIPKKAFEKIIKKDATTALLLSVAISRKLSELRHRIVDQENKTTIAVFYNEGDPKDKAWLAMETALYLEDIHNKPETIISPELKQKKKVLLIDLNSDPQKYDEILNKKINYDFIIINLPITKTTLTPSFIINADFIINLSKKNLKFYKNIYNKNLHIVNINLEHDKALERVEWRIGNIARTIAKTTIGIAFSAAAAGGMAQVGTMQAIVEKKIPIDMIAGVCGGAMYGAMYAVGKSYQDSKNYLCKRYLRPFAVLRNLDFAKSKLGLSSGKNIIQPLTKFLKTNRIENFKIPFRIVTSDLKSKDKVIFKEGDYSFALKATLALMVFFTPVKYNKTYLMDGVYATPVPASILREEGINKVISFNVIEDKKNSAQMNNLLELTMTVKNIFTKSIKKHELKISDKVIDINTSRYGYYDYKQVKKILSLGHTTGKRFLKSLISK